MALTNTLKNQVDIPVWEWCRLAPGVSSALSSTCTADNSLYHVSFGRYIYYLQTSTTTATTTGSSGFFRYDTISDTYQLLAIPPIPVATYSAMTFAGGKGYFGRVISGGTNTLQTSALAGKTLVGFDIRIIGGTGDGQQRIITDVSNPVIADNGTLTAVAASPQNSVTDANKNWVINQWVGYQVRFLSASGQSQIRKILYNTSTTLVFADVAKFAEEQFAWSPIVTTAGSTLVIAAVGSLYQIESSTITVDSNWLVQPDETSRFVVRSGGIWLNSSGATFTLQYYDIAADAWYVRNAGAATSPVTAVGTEVNSQATGENACVWERGIALGTHSTTTLQDTTKSWTTNQWVGYYVRIFSGTAEGQTRVITSNTANTLTWISAGTAPDGTSRYFIDGFDVGTASTAGQNTQTGVSTGTINGTVFTAGTTTGAYYPGQILNGTGVQTTAVITSAALACFTTGTVTTVNIAAGSTTGIVAGMIVTLVAGAGTIPANTTVASVTATTVVLSASVTVALSAATLQFATAYATATSAATSNGPKITLGSGNTTGLVPGMFVSVTGGTGTITAGTYVLSVDSSSSFTLSAPPTVALSGANIVTCQPYQTVIIEQLTGESGGAGTYRVFPSQIVASTSITGTGITSISDSSKYWTSGRWNGQQVRIKSGLGIGQVRNIIGTVPGPVTYISAAGATSSGLVITVTDTTGLVAGMVVNITAGVGSFIYGATVTSITNGTTFTVSDVPTIPLSGGSTVVTGAGINTLLVSNAWTTVPDSTSIYTIHGDADKVYFSMAGQTPIFIQNLDADMITIGRQYEAGVARGVSAQFSDYQAHAISAGVPVQLITGAVGVTTAVATTAAASSAGTATINYSGAPFVVGTYVTVVGVTPAGFNGTYKVTASTANSVSYLNATAGPQTVAGTVAQAQSITFGSTATLGVGTSVTIVGCVPVAYNGTFAITASSSGSVAFVGTATGNLTTVGYIQQVAQATTGGSMASTTATLTCSNTIYPVASQIVVSGCTPGTYNGVQTVTASSAGSVSYVPTVTPSGSITVQGNIQIVTTKQLVTTVNSHTFKTGQNIVHRGDTGFSATNTNITAAVTPLPGTSNQYTYTVSASGPMVVYGQSTTQLVDANKNWIPNQWVGCMVTYNSTQFTVANLQPTILSAYVLANTANTLIFAAAHSAAPVQGISRYVITAPSTSVFKNVIGSSDSGLALGVQSAAVLTDVTKSWATPAVVAGITGTGTNGANTITASVITNIYPGMLVAVTAGTATLANPTTVTSISGSVVTLSNTFGGSTGAVTLSFQATCSSSGTTVTVAGYSTLGLSPGMYVGVTSATNMSSFVPSSGAFVANGGTNLTTVQVASILSATQFTVTTTPAIALSNATVQASFWFPNQWVNRRIKLTSGNAVNYLEATCTVSSFNTITVAITTPVSGVTGYTILQQPVRGAGTGISWNFGQNDLTRRGSYLIQARGGNLTGFDRLDLRTDKWEFLTPTPNFEGLTTGAMYAYDGADRIYFTPQVTQRVYYFDIDKILIHGGSQYPYVAGTAIVGNRMEIFETSDGLKFLWLNRHSFQECFKQLLFY